MKDTLTGVQLVLFLAKVFFINLQKFFPKYSRISLTYSSSMISIKILFYCFVLSAQLMGGHCCHFHFILVLIKHIRHFNFLHLITVWPFQWPLKCHWANGTLAVKEFPLHLSWLDIRTIEKYINVLFHTLMCVSIFNK